MLYYYRLNPLKELDNAVQIYKVLWCPRHIMHLVITEEENESFI